MASVAVCLALALLLLASFLGALHPLGDSLAVFRLPLGLGLLIMSFGLPGPLKPVALAVALASQLPMLAIRVAPQPSAGDYSHYQKNLWVDLRKSDGILTDIAAMAPDTISFQEVGDWNKDNILQPLAAQYRAHAFCGFGWVGGIAVLSRWPALEPPNCEEGRKYGMVALKVDHPDGPLWLVSIHLHWPYPDRQPEQLDRLLPRLSALDAPVLVGGDFNMVRWSHAVADIARATGTRAQGRAPITLHVPPEGVSAALAIDHVLVPSGRAGRLERRPRHGSDHYGLFLRWN
ncbi:MAG: endonuclease/exonuclease/phosphatase family protein [Pseudomonadota bacterium]